MTLDNSKVVDAVGTDKLTGAVVLTIIDYWDWSDVRGHLLALQEKLNSYFEFVESGQIYQSYPEAQGKSVCIDIVSRHAIPAAGETFLRKASDVAAKIDLSITSRVHTSS